MANFAIVFAIVYNLPKFFEIRHSFVAVTQTGGSDNDVEIEEGLEEGESIGRNDTFQIQLVTSPLRLNWWYVTFYLFWSKFLFIELIPYILMMVMNYLIWKRITSLAIVSRSQRSSRIVRATRSSRLQPNGISSGKMLFYFKGMIEYRINPILAYTSH